MLVGITLWGIYKREKNIIAIILLFISFLFLTINIFKIKGGVDESIENIEGGKVVFILDVSKSMNAKDIKSENYFISRFDATKLLISGYLSKYIENNYGLIIFAGEALETLPFTNDIGIYKTVLYGVNNSNVSKYGTNLNSVFNSLHNYFTEDNEGGLAVIFTDGGDEKIDISNELINSLKNKNIKVLLVGVGTEGGAKIENGNDFFGRTIYKTYNGEVVISKLNSKTLKDISSKYNLGYISLDNENKFKKINNYITDNIDFINLEKNVAYRKDYTRLFIFISFCFFILYFGYINFLWKRK